MMFDGKLGLSTFLFAVEVEKKSKGIKNAKKADVHVVDEGFLEDVKKGEVPKQIKEHSICDWGSEVYNVSIEIV